MENKFGGKIYIVDVLMLAWWVYVLTRTYFLPGVPCCREMVTYSSLLLLYVLVRVVDGSFRLPSKVYVGGLLGVVLWQLLLGVYQLYSGTSHHHLYPVTGSFDNPGPYSALVAMGVVMALDMIHYKKYGMGRIGKLMEGLCWSVLCGGCMMLSLTFSRSAFLVVGLMLAWTYRPFIIKHRVVIGILMVVLSAVLFYLKLGSALGRIVIWWQALNMWMEHKLLGVGVGAFAGEYGKQSECFFADSWHVRLFSPYTDVAEDAFCDFLQLGAEQGLVGATLCCAIIGLSLRGLRDKSMTLCYALIALLVFSLFSYPFQLLPFQALAVFMMAIGAEGKVLARMRIWQMMIVCAICGSMGVGCWKIGRAYQKAHQKAFFLTGATHESFLMDFYRLLPSCSDDKRFLFDFAKILQINGRYQDSNAMLRRGTEVSCDPMFWVLMGNNYRQLRQREEALRCYDRAFRRMPNRLYPLYQKMQTLEEMNEMAEMRKVARQIMTFRPKIESSATKEMKKKAQAKIEN